MKTKKGEISTDRLSRTSHLSRQYRELPQKRKIRLKTTTGYQQRRKTNQETIKKNFLTQLIFLLMNIFGNLEDFQTSRRGKQSSVPKVSKCCYRQSHNTQGQEL